MCPFPPHLPSAFASPHAPHPPQILEAGSSQPSALYGPFLEKLALTVRDDIADCCAASYASLTISEALKMLKLQGGSPALAAYASSRGLEWAIDGEVVRFAPIDKPRARVDAHVLMENTLSYANDLERIV